MAFPSRVFSARSAGFCVAHRRSSMIRPILKYGDSILHEKARVVDAITPDIDRLVDDMIETMYAAPGVGLAAPQVGVPLRIFVVDVSVGRDPGGLLVMINPEFVERDGMQLEEEGCLSVPGFNATVMRPMRAVVKGLDRHGAGVSARRQRPARPRLSARDGSPGRHAVRRPPPRHQARPHRPENPQAHARRQMVAGGRAPGRVLRHAGVRRPDARGAASLAPHGRRRRHAAGSPARPRPEDVGGAGQGLRGRGRAAGAAARTAEGPGVSRAACRRSAPTSASSPRTARSSPTPCWRRRRSA